MKRTFDMADKLLQVGGRVNFETRDILRAVVEGCVGAAAATELLAWAKLCQSAPTIDEVVVSPGTAKLPTDLGVYYALTMTLTDYAGGEARKVAKSATEAIAKYGLRWPEEQAAYLFKRLVEKAPLVVTTDAWQQWQKKRNAA